MAKGDRRNSPKMKRRKAQVAKKARLKRRRVEKAPAPAKSTRKPREKAPAAEKAAPAEKA